jgi:preprotein translocase subunit SecY
VVSFGIFILATVMATMMAEVIVPCLDYQMKSSLSLLMYHSTHVLVVIVFLFFLHTGGTRVPVVSKKRNMNKK